MNCIPVEMDQGNMVHNDVISQPEALQSQMKVMQQKPMGISS